VSAGQAAYEEWGRVKLRGTAIPWTHLDGVDHAHWEAIAQAADTSLTAQRDELSEHLAVTRERLRILAALLGEILATWNTVVSDEQWDIWQQRAGLGGVAVPVPARCARLEEIRLVLASSGWETSPADVFALVNAARDWRDALEAIDRIVNGGEQ
jgi:hypothetical protein